MRKPNEIQKALVRLIAEEIGCRIVPPRSRDETYSLRPDDALGIEEYEYYDSEEEAWERLCALVLNKILEH